MYDFLDFELNLLPISALILLSCVISFLITMIPWNAAVSEVDFEKTSTYECGFEPFDDARQKFNINFCLVAILFLIFDIEIIFLFPWVMAFDFLSYQGFWGMIVFLIVLTLGFIYELSLNALDWQ